MSISGPRGTHDILPEESFLWQRIESKLREISSKYGYYEVRTPIFEHTELFERGVGDTTDIVQKEMYTFMDRGQRSITLRPESTASCVRSFVEHKIYSQAQPTKWYYMGPMFRYDRPQAGRFRQFHQFGVEVFGSRDPHLDAEVIHLLVEIVRQMGVSSWELRLNSVGCPQCRPLYRRILLDFLNPIMPKLCPDCVNRMEKNPLRVLDCKTPQCIDAVQGHPAMAEHLCSDCDDHFSRVKRALTLLGTEFVLDPQLVRGLDYYTNTAFELLLPDMGAQSAVGGGGRYDGLVEECGGPPTPGIGFAMGLERLMIAVRKQSPEGLATVDPVKVFVAAAEEDYADDALQLLFRLREAGISSDKDYLQRSLKAQMKLAGKLGSRLVVVIGEDEKKNGYYVLRDMSGHEQRQIPADSIIEEIRSILAKP